MENLNVKKLGFGLMRLPMLNGKVDIEQTKKMVDLFMSKGFTYFDTAYGYINETSESAIKTALVDRYSRESFCLVTKLPAFAAKNAEAEKQMFWTSLRRTGAKYFDFYLLHNIGGLCRLSGCTFVQASGGGFCTASNKLCGLGR